jgi:hypothetical protein
VIPKDINFAFKSINTKNREEHMVHIHQIHIFMRCIGRTADVGLLIVGCDFEWLEMLLIYTVELIGGAGDTGQNSASVFG